MDLTNPYAMVFPGAGAQFPGMASRLHRAFPLVRELFDEADERSGLPLARTCLDGDVSDLKRPSLSHPAIFLTGVACSRAMLERLGDDWRPPALVGGHSLGQYAALVHAAVLDFADALRVVVRRSALMEEQSRVRAAGMVAIRGVAPDVVEQLCLRCPERLGVVVVGCYNGPEHSVVSGDAAAVDWVAAQSAGKTRKVDTGVASHSPLMEPANRELRPLIAELPMRTPAMPVLLSGSGLPSAEVDELRSDLAWQLLAPVRWSTSLQSIVDAGVTVLMDAGPGSVMAKTVEHRPELTAVVLNFMEPLDHVLAAMG